MVIHRAKIKPFQALFTVGVHLPTPTKKTAQKGVKMPHRGQKKKTAIYSGVDPKAKEKPPIGGLALF